jgi:hypothetical protein
MKTYALRFPGRATYCEIVEAESFAEALKAANAPEGTTGNGIFRAVAFQMVEHGIAVWPQQEAREWEAANAFFESKA